MVVRTPRRNGVYLDTNVLIDLRHALDGQWRPPVEPSRTERQWLAAVRLLFYGYEGRDERWWLVTSGEARREVLAKESYDWTQALLHDVDGTRDAPDASRVHHLAEDFVSIVDLTPSDARHLAGVVLRPWIWSLITNDDRFRKKARRLALPYPLEIWSSLEAEQALRISPGEKPPISPAPSSPLAKVDPWWIPK